MSQEKIFPVYTVRSQDGKPCGHQHQTEDRADNCAINLARASRGRTFTVLQRHRGGSEVGSASGAENVMSMFEVSKNGS